MKITPASELTRRITALQELLQQKCIDGALIMENADLFYFAGTAQRAHLFIPAAGKPLLMVNRDLARAQRESTLEEIIPLTSMRDLPGQLGDYGFDHIKSLGLELDVLPAALYLRYQRLFAGTDIIDISKLIRRVRMVKSPYEIEMVRGAAGLNYTFFSRVKDYLIEGVSEVELAADLEAVLRRAGHQGLIRMRGFNQEIFYGHVMSGTNASMPSYIDSPNGGPGLSPSFPQGPNRKKIARNEAVLVDYVGVYAGYLADQTRTFCIGSLSDQLVRAYEVALHIQEDIKKMAVPGALCEDLYRHAISIARQSPYGAYFMGHPEPVRFMGHGVGIEVNEWPVLAQGFKIPLAKGMVIALEPKFIFPEGVVGIENTFVAGENGLETLTVFDENIIYV